MAQLPDAYITLHLDTSQFNKELRRATAAMDRLNWEIARRPKTRRAWLRVWVAWRLRRPRPEGRRYREFQAALWAWRKHRPIWPLKPWRAYWKEEKRG